MWWCTRFVYVLVLVTVVTAAAGEEGTNTTEVTTLDCQRCSCGHQDSVFSLHCRLTGVEAVVLDGSGPLSSSSSRTLYVRVENASSLHVGRGFLAALRRHLSVALDLWDIANLTFADDFRPQSKFLFMGMGIVNSSLSELPQGVISHSYAIGLRLSGSSIGVIRRDALANVRMVRYIELTHSHVGEFEGPHVGLLELSHRKEVHHGSAGLRVLNSSIGALQQGAISVHTQQEDEFVEITDSTITELGPDSLSVTGVGYVTVNRSLFRYVATGALDISATGGITLLDTRIWSAAPAPLWLLRGGNGTRLENVTFGQPASASLLLLERPTGDERLSGLRFACEGGRLRAGWTAAATAGGRTVAEGLRRYLERVEQAAECDPTAMEGNRGPHTAASALRPSASGGRGLFGNPTQVGLEFLILAVLAALVTALVAAAVVGRRRRRQRQEEEIGDTRVLVEEPDGPAE